MAKGRRTVQVLMHPADLDEFDDWLRARGDTAVLKSWSQSEVPEVLHSVSLNRSAGETIDVLLAPRDHLSSLSARGFVLGRGYHLDALRAPVVEFQRCYFDDKVLRGGGLAGWTGYWGYRGGAYRWVDKPQGFVQWMESILQRIRRSYSERHASYYVGPHALKWRSNAQGDFAVF